MRFVTRTLLTTNTEHHAFHFPSVIDRLSELDSTYLGILLDHGHHAFRYLTASLRCMESAMTLWAAHAEDFLRFAPSTLFH